MIRNVILTIILLCQVAVWFIVDSPWKTEPTRSEPLATKRLADIDVAQVAFIESTDVGGKTLKLAKRDGVWVLEDLHGFPALQDKVAQALEELVDLSKSEFRSDKTIMHENYEVDVKKGQKLRLLSESRNVLLDLVIGKPDVQGQKGTFVRQADEKDVYVARSQKLSIAFTGEIYDWLKRGMMDVDAQDQQRLLDLKAACYRIEIEGKQMVKDAAGKPAQPPAQKNVRFVYARDPGAPADGSEPVWRVVEPEGKGDLQLADLQIKNMVQQLLSVQVMMNHQIVGPETPEHKLAETDDKELHVIARFKEGESETVRTLDVGAEFEPAAVGGQALAKQRYAKVGHPGDRRQQSFVFTVNSTFGLYFVRDPETLVKRDLPKPPTPGFPTPPPATQPAASQPSSQPATQPK
jgi:hypothetical protein